MISFTEAEALAADPEQVAQTIGIPWPAGWAHRCHEVSLAIVKAQVFGPSRVARGATYHVASQHSWVVLGDDCYHPEIIVDPTLWSYVPSVNGILVTRNTRAYHPHGAGSIWSWGRPVVGHGPLITLTPRTPLSRYAQTFLNLLGPLDRDGWAILAHAPVEDWPAGEIIAAICDTEALAALVPVDIVGMVTDRNPSGLYLAEAP